MKASKNRKVLKQQKLPNAAQGARFNDVFGDLYAKYRL